MTQPAANFPSGMPGEPVNGPVAIGGRAQPLSGTRTIKVKAGKEHTRTIRAKPTKPRPPAKPAVQPLDPQIQAAVDLRFKPQIQANQQQIRNAQFGQVRTQHWYDDYQNLLQANQKAVAQQSQALAQSLGAYNPPAAQTGNAQADALAAQAQQSQRYLGQAVAGTQGQLTQNVANEFATGLIPGAALRSADTQQGLTNQIGQLQQQGGQLKAQAADYGTGLKAQSDAAAQKTAMDKAKIQASLAIAGGRLDLAREILQKVTEPNTQSQIQTRSKTIQLKGQSEADKVKQQGVANALKVNDLQLKTYLAKHPNQKTKDGLTIRQNYRQGIDKGTATLRLLHGTPPAKDPITGTVSKPNPFYNLNPQQIEAHKQDLIDLLQTSAKAGHLTKDQATRAVNQFLRDQNKAHPTIGSIIGGLLNGKK